MGNSEDSRKTHLASQLTLYGKHLGVAQLRLFGLYWDCYDYGYQMLI